MGYSLRACVVVYLFLEVILNDRVRDQGRRLELLDYRPVS
jgi:hypothetical protein